MRDQIHAHLEALKLRRMREIVDAELRRAEAGKTSYSNFLLKLLCEEHADKRERAIERRIQQAGLAERWTLETYPWHRQPCVSKKQHHELAELGFVERAENLVWVGTTGVGKTGLASSILLKALYAGKTGQMVKAQDLFDEFGASLADRTTRRYLKRLARLDVLFIDELGYVAPKPDQVNSFFRLIDSRYGKKPTLISSNLGYFEWPKFLGNETLAAALLRRLLHKCQTITFKNGVNLCDPRNNGKTSPTPTA